jgi:hypothetical protein
MIDDNDGLYICYASLIALLLNDFCLELIQWGLQDLRQLTLHSLSLLHLN